MRQTFYPVPQYMQLVAPLLLLLVLSLASPACGQNGPLRLATLEWPPYIGMELPAEGYVGEVVREAFARSGHAVEYEYMPWKRSVEETRSGKFHAYLPEYFDYALMRDFVFSAPFPGGPLLLFARAGEETVYTSLRELSSRRIGVVRGYVNTREFDAADYLDKHEFVDDLTVLRMLLRGRVDLAVADMHVARHLARTQLGGQGRIKASLPALGCRVLYVCFPKKRADHMELLAAFNAGLSAMDADGSLKATLRRHGFGALLW